MSVVDQGKAKLAAIVSNGFTAVSMGIGFRHGLFKVLCEYSSEENAITSQQLADKMNLRERYLREWLHCMVVADLIQCTKDGTRFWIDSDMALAMSQSRDLMGMNCMLPLLSEVHVKIYNCFKPDGPPGTEYSDYGNFHQFMANASKERKPAHYIFEKLLPELDASLIARLESTCQRIVEIGCGQGDQAQYIAAKYPKCEYVAFDFCSEPIEHAKSINKLANLTYMQMDAKAMAPEWTNKFDMVILFDALHDQARPDLCLLEINRVLNATGVLILVDIDMHTNVVENKNNPISAGLYTASLFHCMPISLNEPDGLGLGTCWGREKAQSMLVDAGFKPPTIHKVDIMNAVYIVHK